MKEEELLNKIAKYKNDRDETAYNDILKQFTPLLHYIINRHDYSKLPITKDDAKSYLRLELIKAIDMYNLDKKVSFFVYLHGVWQNKINTIIRSYYAQKRNVSTQVFMESNHSQTGLSYSDILQDEEDLEYNVEKIVTEEKIDLFIKSKLKQTEYEVYFLRLKGNSYREIATILQIEEKEVKSKISSSKRKLKKFAEEYRDLFQ